MKEKLSNGILSFATKLQNQRHLSAIKNAFTALLPIIIIGSFCTLFSNVICKVDPRYLSLANLPGMSWLEKLDPIFTAANYGTMNFISIGIVILISLELCSYYGVKDKVAALVALASYISLCATTSEIITSTGSIEIVKNTLTSTFTGAQGLFVAMIVALVSSEIYCRLINSGKLEIKMPDSVPPNVSRSFTILFPAFITVLLISTVGWIFSETLGLTIFDAIIKFIQAPLTNVLTGLPGYLLLIFLTTVLWSFGIHGTQTLKPIYDPILLAAYASNEIAYAAGAEIPNIISTPFISSFSIVTGAGITGGLILAILIFSKREDYRAITKISIPCAIFNVNEPMIFGLPIVLNPLLAVPFMLAPVVTSAFGYFMTYIGFAGKLVVNVPWTTPPGIMAFLSSGGSVGAAVTQLLCILIAFLIYTPFVLLANKQPIETPMDEFMEEVIDE